MRSFIDGQSIDYGKTSCALKRKETIGLKLGLGKCGKTKVFQLNLYVFPFFNPLTATSRNKYRKNLKFHRSLSCTMLLRTFFSLQLFQAQISNSFPEILESSSILFVRIVHHHKIVKAKSNGNSNKTLNHYSKFQTTQPMDSNGYVGVGNTFHTTTVSFCCDRLQSNFCQC